MNDRFLDVSGVVLFIPIAFEQLVKSNIAFSYPQNTYGCAPLYPHSVLNICSCACISSR
jgi:hypothetical protein